MLTPCLLAFVRLPSISGKKLKFLGLGNFAENFLCPIYEFLCLRSVNYEAFKYTCALRSTQQTNEKKIA